MPALDSDRDNLPGVLEAALALAVDFLATLPERPAGASPVSMDGMRLPADGIGAMEALSLFQRRYWNGLTGSAGPRYWGFVTGGSTPAALAGDWLTAAFDQNATGGTEPAAAQIERDALAMLRQLFRLPDTFSGAFVTGATMANFVGLALGRQWAARQHGIDASQAGLFGLAQIPVLSGSPHSSIFKALSMSGLGRDALTLVKIQKGREAVDVGELRAALAGLEGRPAVVVANAGTVNTVDFDDLNAVATLKDEFNFWLHVDAAFGGFAAASERYWPLVAGLEQADSITIDAHKWLNVPYDSAMQFTRRQDLQVEVFQNSAAYLGEVGDNPDYVHLTPENSRRLRALPAWLTLTAYGATGYREIVERNCDLAAELAQRINDSAYFELLSPARLNVVCFTLVGRPDPATLRRFLEAVRDTGQVFLTPTVYAGQAAIRAAFSNWRTRMADLDIAWDALIRMAKSA